MTVQEAIAAAEVLLPGRVAPDGRIDPRWQAIIAVGEFIETQPDAVWLFIRVVSRQVPHVGSHRDG